MAKRQTRRRAPAGAVWDASSGRWRLRGRFVGGAPPKPPKPPKPAYVPVGNVRFDEQRRRWVDERNRFVRGPIPVKEYLDFLQYKRVEELRKEAEEQYRAHIEEIKRRVLEAGAKEEEPALHYPVSYVPIGESIGSGHSYYAHTQRLPFGGRLVETFAAYARNVARQSGMDADEIHMTSVFVAVNPIATSRELSRAVDKMTERAQQMGATRMYVTAEGYVFEFVMRGKGTELGSEYLERALPILEHVWDDWYGTIFWDVGFGAQESYYEIAVSRRKGA